MRDETRIIDLDPASLLARWSHALLQAFLAGLLSLTIAVFLLALGYSQNWFAVEKPRSSQTDQPQYAPPSPPKPAEPIIQTIIEEVIIEVAKPTLWPLIYRLQKGENFGQELAAVKPLLQTDEYQRLEAYKDLDIPTKRALMDELQAQQKDDAVMPHKWLMATALWLQDISGGAIRVRHVPSQWQVETRLLAAFQANDKALLEQEIRQLSVQKAEELAVWLEKLRRYQDVQEFIAILQKRAVQS